MFPRHRLGHSGAGVGGRVLCALVLCVTAAPPGSAQGPSRAEPALLAAVRHREVVDRMATMLAEIYVFPELGRKCAVRLRQALAAGTFAELGDPERFAAMLTEMLRQVTRDQHLLVRVRLPELAELKNQDPIAARLRGEEEMRRSNFGFHRLDVLEGNIGYVDIRAFHPGHLARDTMTGAMAFLANADAIVIDLRENQGGYPETVQLVCSYFFDQPTHLNSLYFREGDRTIEFWTLDELPGKRMPDVPLFILTSSKTFSGAEEFCYNLRTRERAILVGETTRGGANPGQLRAIDDQFEMVIPTGRAINPVTKTNWDGTGVKPHIEVSANRAMDRALVEAGKAAEAYRQRRPSRLAIWTEMQARLETAHEQLVDGAPGTIRETVRTALETGLDGELLNEGRINMLGYQQLESGRIETAIEIFQFNADSFPDSANVWDSLAEAHLKHGDAHQALRHYQTSLQLDPENENARGLIHRLRAQPRSK